MKRLLLIVPAGLALGLAAALLAPWFPNSPAYPDISGKIAVTLAGLLAFWSCTRAGRGFDRGGNLQLAWTVMGMNYGIIAVTEWLPFGNQGLLATATLAATVLVNVLGVTAIVFFARAFHGAGLEIPGSLRRKLIIYGLTIVLALVIDGWPIVDTIHRIQAGDVRTELYLISSVGDLITFMLVGPILLTALALRGGLLVWPWAFLTASNLSWFFLDLSGVIQMAFPTINPEALLFWQDTWQCLACALAFAAGEAQRRASQGNDPR